MRTVNTFEKDRIADTFNEFKYKFNIKILPLILRWTLSYPDQFSYKILLI